MNKLRFQYWLAFAAALAFAVLVDSPARAQSTAFTYQGLLDDAGAPTNGLHDFRFRLFDAATGGVQVGSTLCVDNLDVIEGAFTSQLDFGQQYATTAQRYLEISVRRDTGLTCGNATGLVVLAPRQQLTAAPMASHANSAFALDAADGSPAGAVFVDNSGNVGIGTITPATKLHVKGAAEGLRIDGSGVGVANVSYASFRDSNGARTGYVGDGGSSDNSVYLTADAGDVHLYTVVGAAVTAKSDGKVGIGTTTPRSSLHVNGQCVWLTGGNGGGLPTAAGAGLRLYDDGSRSNIFAWDYAANIPRTLVLQEPGGNVGIGTTAPAAKLDVRGDIRLGSSGQLQAAAGVENLRLLRGTIDGNGTIDAGTGFTSQRLSEGWYLITFSTPFSSVPTVTTSAVQPWAETMRWASLTDGWLTASSMRISIHTGSTSNTDSDFSFCVIGPR